MFAAATQKACKEVTSHILQVLENDDGTWTVFELATQRPALIDGVEQIYVDYEDACTIAYALNQFPPSDETRQ